MGPASARKERGAARLEEVTLASVAPYALLTTMKSYGDQEHFTSGDYNTKEVPKPYSARKHLVLTWRSALDAMAADPTGPEQPGGVPSSDVRKLFSRRADNRHSGV